MKKFSVLVLAVAMTMAMSTTAAAAGFDMDKFYIGGGIGYNDLSGYDEAIGPNIFVGYDLDFDVGPIKNAFETGVMKTGTFKSPAGDKDYFGPWLAMVGSYSANKTIDLLGRIGFDVGDDSGLLLGAGAGFNLNRNMQIRAEVVVRTDVNSYQANFVYHF